MLAPGLSQLSVPDLEYRLARLHGLAGAQAIYDALVEGDADWCLVPLRTFLLRCEAWTHYAVPPARRRAHAIGYTSEAGFAATVGVPLPAFRTWAVRVFCVLCGIGI